jgi:NAD dependent epimerase/dehydratase family enzyme
VTGPALDLRVAVTGSAGLLGTALVAVLRAHGQQVIRLVRRAPASQDEIAWDPDAPGGGITPGALNGLDAVIHLAGAGVADHRWTPAYQEEIRSSRTGHAGRLTWPPV